jgi:hypothetical protein
VDIIWLKDYPLLEDKVDKLINHHSQNGYGVISACRETQSGEEKLKKTEELKKDLNELGWSYTIGYGGGFREKEGKGNQGKTDTSKPFFNEISLIVYNYNRKDKERKLFDDLLALGKKYHQDDIYYKEPNGKAHWFNQKGEIDATFGDVVKNDPEQANFTGFAKSRLSKNDKKKIKNGKIGNTKAMEHRFTGIMEGINPPPGSFVEQIKRKHAGEVFISPYNVLTSQEVYDLLNKNSCFKY